LLPPLLLLLVLLPPPPHYYYYYIAYFSEQDSNSSSGKRIGGKCVGYHTENREGLSENLFIFSEPERRRS
jgi:hypothetical protein